MARRRALRGHLVGQNAELWTCATKIRKLCIGQGKTCHGWWEWRRPRLPPSLPIAVSPSKLLCVWQPKAPVSSGGYDVPAFMRREWLNNWRWLQRGVTMGRERNEVLVDVEGHLAIGLHSPTSVWPCKTGIWQSRSNAPEPLTLRNGKCERSFPSSTPDFQGRSKALVKATCKGEYGALGYWQGETGSTRRKPCPNENVSITNVTCTDMGSNPGLRGQAGD